MQLFFAVAGEEAENYLLNAPCLISNKLEQELELHHGIKVLYFAAHLTVAFIPSS